MTIDINELRQALGAVQPEEVLELLDRLEAAEKDVAMKEEVIDSLAAVVKRLDAQCDAAEKERDAAELMSLTLRAKLTKMERQEPVKYERRIKRHSDHTWGPWRECYKIDYVKAKATGGYYPKFSDDLFDYEMRPLYALPAVAPKLDEIKTTLQRALELGQRETWTGARKHRSWEDQREEQQCWNKVWSLLGAGCAPSVPDTYAAGINAVAAMLQAKAAEYAKEHGHDDMGGLSFGPGMGGEIKMGYYTNLIELVDDVRAMLAGAPEAKP